MAHVVNPDAEAILDKEFKVLDKGFVRLVDYLGGDERIVQAARVSYGTGTKSFRQDKGLINYLLRNDHTSPFEQVVFTFHVKMPIFVARQWIRHRTARVNEISGRYSKLDPDFYVPDSEYVSPQSENNKQARAPEPMAPDEAEGIRKTLSEGQRRTYEEYEGLLASGLAKEVARINLPLSTYTEIYWQMDLHNLFHFLRLRIHPHAQYEIRAYAEVILGIVHAVCPIAAEAFENHIRGGERLSASELAAVRALAAGEENPLEGREREIFEAKVGIGR